MKNTIDNIFSLVNYWQEKRLLLSAISPDYYHNKYVILALLGVTPQTISATNLAKKDMWNHQLKRYNMGDDILQNTSKTVLNDKDFATKAIVKYNRTYIYLSDELKKVKNDLKSLRTRNSQYRMEGDKLRQHIKELEGKIEALL